MLISKNYLKQIIKEELTRVDEDNYREVEQQQTLKLDH